jgi:type 1 glutamine amidotransferase
MPVRTLLLGGLTTGFHQFWTHAPALRGLLAEHDCDVRCSEDIEVLASPGLAAAYDLIVNITTGRQLSPAQETGLLGFLRGGGGLCGIHSATDSFKDSAQYMAAIGGRFLRHPPQLDIAVEFTDPEHPVTAGLPPFSVRDELYILDWNPETVHLLARTFSHEGSPQPVSWVRQEGSGRVFYVSLGHNRDTYDVPTFRTWVGRGARWAAGAL